MAFGDARIRDKVQIRSGNDSGKRGIVTRVTRGICLIHLDDGGDTKVHIEQLRNFSSAARKAWEAMPSRQVGRPKGSKRSDRVSVTLRFDTTLWQRFLNMEKEGIIKDRTLLFNQALSKIVESRSRTEHV